MYLVTDGVVRANSKRVVPSYSNEVSFHAQQNEESIVANTSTRIGIQSKIR